MLEQCGKVTHSNDPFFGCSSFSFTLFVSSSLVFGLKITSQGLTTHTPGKNRRRWASLIHISHAHACICVCNALFHDDSTLMDDRTHTHLLIHLLTLDYLSPTANTTTTMLMMRVVTFRAAYTWSSSPVPLLRPLSVALFPTDRATA